MSHSLTSVRSQVQPSLTIGEHRRIDLLNESRKYVCMCQMRPGDFLRKSALKWPALCHGDN